MKVCFITEDIATMGGRQRVTATICNGLIENTEIDVYILFTSPMNKVKKPAYILNEKVNILWNKKIAKGKYSNLFLKVFRYFNKNIKPIKSVRFLEKIYFPSSEKKAYENYLNKYNFDVMVGVGSRASAMLSLLDINCKKIGWMHCSYDLYFFTKGCFQYQQEKLYKKLFQKLNNIVCLTDNDAHIYKSELNKSINKIYNPLAFKTDEKSEFNENELLFVGRLDYEIKGLDLLIDSLSYLNKFNQQWHLTIVGDGQGKENLIKEIQKKGLEGYISIIGFTDNVLSYYQKSSILLLPSRSEGFGLVVIEAMECGVPVISYETDGPSEIIDNEIDGYLIKKYDTESFAKKIEYLLNNENERLKLSKNAIKKAKNFSIENIVNQWIQIFEI